MPNFKTAADPTTGQQINFNEKTIEALLKMHFVQEKAKISSDAMKLINEVVRVHALELMSRSAQQAKSEGSEIVKSEHLEKVLPQFLLDFC